MFFVYAFIIGACIGSFINVVAYRLPRNESVITPRSHCRYCKYKLKWYENIPLISWIILRGKCRACKNTISGSYFVIELFCACLFFICNFTSYANYANNMIIYSTIGGWLFSSFLLFFIVYLAFNHPY